MVTRWEVFRLRGVLCSKRWGACQDAGRQPLRVLTRNAAIALRNRPDRGRAL